MKGFVIFESLKRPIERKKSLTKASQIYELYLNHVISKLKLIVQK